MLLHATLQLCSKIILAYNWLSPIPYCIAIVSSHYQSHKFIAETDACTVATIAFNLCDYGLPCIKANKHASMQA